MLSYTFFKREKIPEKEERKMKNVTRSVRFVLSMVLVMAMVLTSIGSFGTVAKAQTGRAADGLKGIYRIYHTEDATQ